MTTGTRVKHGLETVMGQIRTMTIFTVVKAPRTANIRPPNIAVLKHTQMALSILLPTLSLCTDREACERYVEDLLATQNDFLRLNPAANVIFGMDAHDPASGILAKKLDKSTGHQR